MDLQILISNITNPTLLFFLLGIIAVTIKSDLQIPESSSKFISLYLLFAIGFKGGQELAHSEYSNEITYTLLFGLIMALVVPAYTFFILKRKLSASDSGAIAAGYETGSRQQQRDQRSEGEDDVGDQPGRTLQEQAGQAEHDPELDQPSNHVQRQYPDSVHLVYPPLD